MPRLGSESDNGRDRRAGSPRRQASAYPGSGGLNFSHLVIFVACSFILKNIFFHDYRSEEISSLRASGKSAEEIGAYVPQSAAERRQSLLAKQALMEQMVADIALLKAEVQDLKMKITTSEHLDAGHTKSGHRKDPGEGVDGIPSSAATSTGGTVDTDEHSESGSDHKSNERPLSDESHIAKIQSVKTIDAMQDPRRAQKPLPHVAEAANRATESAGESSMGQTTRH